MKIKFSSTFLILISCLVFSLAPLDTQAQKRQRAKSKQKTTKVTTSSKKPKTSAEAKKLQADTQKEIKLTEQQIKENESNVKKSLNQLGKIEGQISETNTNIKNLNSKLSQLSTEISSLESGIQKNENDLEILRAEYLKAVKKLRVTKKNNSTLAFIFSSKNFSQAMRRMRYLREFSQWRGRQTEEINAKTADLKNQRDALAKAKDEQANALQLQKKNMAQLDRQHIEQENIVADLKKNGAALQSHLKKKQAEASELGSIVSQLIAQEQQKAAEDARRKAEEEARRKAAAEEEERRKAAEEENQRLLASQTGPTQASPEKKNKQKENKSQEKKSSKEKNAEYASARKRAPRNAASDNKSSGADSGNASFSSMRGKLPYPSSGSFSIISRFGRQSMPDLPDVEFDNPGIDAESEPGASARAVFKGKVSGVYLLPGYNTVVIVNHGDYYTVYGNIANPYVKIGDNVDSGTNLGTLALNDDDSSHSSIHFEVWKNREKLNPQDWLH